MEALNQPASCTRSSPAKSPPTRPHPGGAREPPDAGRRGALPRRARFPLPSLSSLQHGLEGTRGSSWNLFSPPPSVEFPKPC